MFGFKKAKKQTNFHRKFTSQPHLNILALLTHSGYRAERKQTVQIANGSQATVWLKDVILFCVFVVVEMFLDK